MIWLIATVGGLFGFLLAVLADFPLTTWQFWVFLLVFLAYGEVKAWSAVRR